MKPAEPTLPSPRARTCVEMSFAASLHPCPHCGATNTAGKLDLIGSGESWSLDGPCTLCGRRRWLAWATEGHPLEGAYPPFQLGDSRPSQVIQPAQFLAELNRYLARVGPDPEILLPDGWRASVAAIQRCHTCLHELLKYIPPDAAEIPAALLPSTPSVEWSERLSRAWLQGELARLEALFDRYGHDAERIWALEAAARTETPPRGTLDRESLRAHAAWVRAGRQGEGRLDVVGAYAREAGLGGAELTGAYLERVDLRRALLDATRLEESELHGVNAVEAIATSVQLSRATLVGGSFTRASLALAVFQDARVTGVDFTSAWLDRSCWNGAVVEDARFDGAGFGNASLSGAHFRRCSFRGADFSLQNDWLAAPAVGAVFEECDLRGSGWQDRDLSGAVFLRCRMFGLHGRPASRTDLRIEAPDLSPEDGSPSVPTAEAGLDPWSLPPPPPPTEAAPSPAPLRLRGFALSAVHGLWGGLALLATNDRCVLVQEVDPAQVEVRRLVSLPAAEWDAVEQLAGAAALELPFPPLPPGIPDALLVTLWLQPRDGADLCLFGWERDLPPTLAQLYDGIRALGSLPGPVLKKGPYSAIHPVT